MTLNRLLLLLAVLCALVAAILYFGWVTTDDAGTAPGLVSVAIALLAGAFLVPPTTVP